MLMKNAQGAAINVDSPLYIASAVILSKIGGAAFIVQPGFVQGMVNYLGFTDQQAGYAASAEMFGFAITTMILVFVSDRINWRTAMRVLLAIVVASNAACLISERFEFFTAMRFLAGIGGGGLVSLTFASLGKTSNPDRNYGIMVSCAMVFAAIVLFLMPTIYSNWGMRGFITFLLLYSLIGFPLTAFLPTSGEQHGQEEADAVDLPGGLKAFAIAAMLAYFVGQGGVWAYLGLMGEAGGASEQAVANALTFAQIAGIGGAMTAVILGARFGRLPPLILAIACGVIPLLVLMAGNGSMVYGGSVFVYNYGFNLAHPFLLATMAAFDRTGKVVVFAVAAQTAGMAVGPALAALLVENGVGAQVNIFGIVFFLLSIGLITPPALAQWRLLKARRVAA